MIEAAPDRIDEREVGHEAERVGPESARRVERGLVRRVQGASRSCAHFLVPADLVGDPQALRITLTLNGEVMQNESTKDMMFGVAALVAAASQIVPLLPGDLLTGSPAGNGIHHGRLLRAGDVMESTITGLGLQRTACVTP